jgi:hypothetical protein
VRRGSITYRLPSAETAKSKSVQIFARTLQGENGGGNRSRHRDGAYKARQASFFEQQLDLAVELGPERRHPSARRLGRHTGDDARVHRQIAWRLSLIRRDRRGR